MTTTIREVCIHHHLGLGDQLDCNGLVRHYAKTRDKVYVFAKEHHHEMISYMYRDNKKIAVVPINPSENEYKEVEDFLDTKPGIEFRVIGHKNYNPMLEKIHNLNCWQQFYLLADISMEERWRGFYFMRNEEEEKRVYEKLNPTGEPYIFLHDDPERGFEIDRKKINSGELRVITNDVSENMFHFVEVLRGAEEIHCMESSFKSLVELVGVESKLYFHDFRNHPLGDARAGWEIVEYE
tara:strand:+ start:2163 stop:2876 length:714 start_codon:yes stop_codon:yes gene_type:complete